jgi:hypothetical protein
MADSSCLWSLQYPVTADSRRQKGDEKGKGRRRRSCSTVAVVAAGGALAPTHGVQQTKPSSKAILAVSNSVSAQRQRGSGLRLGAPSKTRLVYLQNMEM